MHTDYERERVSLFFKVRDLSGSKLAEDTVERIDVITGKLFSQFSEKSGLLGGEGFCVKMKPLSDFDTSSITTGGLNWV